MSSSPPTLITPDFSGIFKWGEYLVFGGVLAASLGIGVFYGCFGSKNKTNEEFLMAGRSMSILPVTLSLVCSFVSAITLLGNPVEVYFYGTQYQMIAFAFIPMTIILAYLYVPVYFSLGLTSAYEYFEWRFSSKVRMLLSAFAVIHLIIYMPTTVYGPSLALDQVAGINRYMSCAAIFLVCIAYSSLGGLKAVLWTDALQALVMVVALFCITIFGIKEVGGIDLIWEITKNGDRVEFFNFDPDPRTRHTFWTAILGGFLMWLPLFGATQAQIQRYNSVPTLRQSRLCLLFNMIGMMLVISLCSLIGIMIYAKYYLCDPVESEAVSSPDQLLPMFVLDVLRDYPGIPGLLVAGLTCGSLSTVSSALNSLTAIIVEDYVKRFKPGLSEIRLGTISKIISASCGLVAFALVFIIAEVNKSIQISPFSTLMHGAFLGPILSAFSLGIFIPWSNDLGVFLGILASLPITGFIGLGNIIAGMEDLLPNQRLSLNISGCEYETTTSQSFVNFDSKFRAQNDWKNEKEYSFAVKMWTTSYIWLPGIGEISTFVFGMVFSAILNSANGEKYRKKVNHSLLSKPLLRFWKFCFGQKFLNKWVDYEGPSFSKLNLDSYVKNVDFVDEKL